MKKVTASDVASYLGVSRSSVSRAFTEGASIAPKQKANILEAAKKLGYQPNLLARTLSTPSQKAKSHLVAILISDFSNPYQPYLFEALSTALRKQGKMPMLISVSNDSDLDSTIQKLSGYQVDGVIAVAGSLPASSFEQCLELQLPLITLGRSDPNSVIPSIQTDNEQAGRLAARHLLSKGLTELGYIKGRTDGEASIARHHGFRAELQETGITTCTTFDAGSYGYSAGFEVGVRHSEDIRKLQGVFCASDALAFGFIDSCKQVNGITIPGQIQVVGCDNVPMSSWQGYQLTTVAQPVHTITEQAILYLGMLLKNKTNGSHTGANPVFPSAQLITPELIVRRT
ncbi:substrate-binding domain-containing protein [uncultured Vibrio sp.]|uniref:LacI family DNA-binding transcriptional regulator n=1 Tax=uncultured Vibrio sp. TaxID=114054 RepID=UPI0026209059|nr:substrate-binding domain-containing protein [uncultured Vibrio sp.]